MPVRRRAGATPMPTIRLAGDAPGDDEAGGRRLRRRRDPGDRGPHAGRREQAFAHRRAQRLAEAVNVEPVQDRLAGRKQPDIHHR